MRGRLPRDADIDLGLSIIEGMITDGKIKPGVPLPDWFQAAFCGCSRQRIQQIAERGLRKMRFRLSREPDVLEALKIMAKS